MAVEVLLGGIGRGREGQVEYCSRTLLSSKLLCNRMCFPPLTPRYLMQAAAGQLLATGDSEGVVRLWDVYGEQPTLLGSVPSAAAAAALTALDAANHRPNPGAAGTGSDGGAAVGAGQLLAVTALLLEPEGDLLATGHANGEVRQGEGQRGGGRAMGWGRGGGIGVGDKR